MFLLEGKLGERAKAFRTFGVTFIWQFCRNCFSVSMPMLKIYIHFLTIVYRPLLFFECGQKIFGLLTKIFQQGGQNFIPRVQKNFRGSDVFDRNLSSYHFWSLSGKHFDVCQIFVI